MGISSADGGAMSIMSDNQHIYLEDCSFVNNIALNAGGALFFGLDNIYINQTEFRKNYALFGGGIYVGANHYQMTLRDVIVSGNTADNGAGIYIDRLNAKMQLDSVVVSYNEAWLNGSGMYIYASAIDISNSEIASNHALIDGGGFYLISVSVRLWNVVVAQNHAEEFGGGMLAMNTYMNQWNCTFLQNMAVTQRGGGMYILQAQYIRLHHNTFMQNNAYLDGGAMFVLIGEGLEILSSLFQENNATKGSGGAIHVISFTNHSISNTQFLHNIAHDNGAAIYTNIAEYQHIQNSLFHHNVAWNGNGGAIFLSHANIMFHQINQFEFNQALLGGGGCVYWMYMSNMHEPYGMHAATFQCSNTNRALYGSNLSTDLMQLSILNSNPMYMNNYELESVPTIYIALQDYYSNPILNDQSSMIQFSCYNCTSLNEDDAMTVDIGYVIVGKSIDGMVTFKTLEAYCSPGGEMYLHATSEVVVFRALKIIY